MADHVSKYAYASDLSDDVIDHIARYVGAIDWIESRIQFVWVMVEVSDGIAARLWVSDRDSDVRIMAILITESCIYANILGNDIKWDPSADPVYPSADPVYPSADPVDSAWLDPLIDQMNERIFAHEFPDANDNEHHRAVLSAEMRSFMYAVNYASMRGVASAIDAGIIPMGIPADRTGFKMRLTKVVSTACIPPAYLRLVPRICEPAPPPVRRIRWEYVPGGHTIKPWFNCEYKLVAVGSFGLETVVEITAQRYSQGFEVTIYVGCEAVHVSSQDVDQLVISESDKEWLLSRMTCIDQIQTVFSAPGVIRLFYGHYDILNGRYYLNDENPALDHIREALGQ